MPRYKIVKAPVRTEGKLPPGILKSDCNWDYKNADAVDRNLGDYGQLTFYETAGFGWCLATLRIGGVNSERTYAVRISDGAQCRIGNGPHVLSKVQIHIKKSRVKALQKYIDLYTAGAQSANTTRDRISSRRAQGARERAAGKYSWRWDV